MKRSGAFTLLILLWLAAGHFIGPHDATGRESLPQETVESAPAIRESAVAGSWYPDDPSALRSQIVGFLARVPASTYSGHLMALVVPHAGLVYSGQVAAHAYKLLESQSVSTVILLGPSHRARFEGIAVYAGAGFRTPLGVVPIDTDFVRAVTEREKGIVHLPDAHAREHSIEIQLPFLQVVAPKARIVPLLMSDQGADTCRRLAETLAAVMRDHPALLVASSDLSHYHPYDEARRLDTVVSDRVAALDPDGLGRDLAEKKCEACGGGPMVTALLAARHLGATRSEVLTYANSGDVTGRKDDPRGVVGYMAAAVGKGNVERSPAASTSAERANVSAFSSEEKDILHRLARQAVEAACQGGPPPAVGEVPPHLKDLRGAFVTLKKDGHLRGCIGQVLPQGPLAETVSAVAASAAIRDPRFKPVQAAELKDIHIEISVLSPPHRITTVDEIQVGTHGLIVRRNGASGLLLPQVATEQGWGRDAFLEHTCIKAGLPREAWKDKETEIFVFSAEVF